MTNTETNLYAVTWNSEQDCYVLRPALYAGSKDECAEWIVDNPRREPMNYRCTNQRRHGQLSGVD
jgi:hypothetical protein